MRINPNKKVHKIKRDPYKVLAKLDTADLEHRMDITRSQVDAQQAVVDKLHNGTREEDLRSAEAKVREARAEKDFLASDYQRKQDAFQASGGNSPANSYRFFMASMPKTNFTPWRSQSSRRSVCVKSVSPRRRIFRKPALRHSAIARSK